MGKRYVFSSDIMRCGSDQYGNGKCLLKKDSILRVCISFPVFKMKSMNVLN